MVLRLPKVSFQTLPISPIFIFYNGKKGDLHDLYRQKNYTDIFKNPGSYKDFLKKCRYSFYR